MCCITAALSLPSMDDSPVDEDPVLSLSQNMDGAVDNSSGALSLPFMDDGLVLWLPYTDDGAVPSWTSSLSSHHLLGTMTGPLKSKLSGGGVMDS